MAPLMDKERYGGPNRSLERSNIQEAGWSSLCGALIWKSHISPFGILHSGQSTPMIVATLLSVEWLFWILLTLRTQMVLIQVWTENWSINVLVHNLDPCQIICVDSCRDVLIENCYISVGDDCIAIKSGWDQYGIAYGRASRNIVVRNIIAHSPVRYHLSPEIFRLYVHGMWIRKPICVGWKFFLYRILETYLLFYTEHDTCIYPTLNLKPQPQVCIA